MFTAQRLVLLAATSALVVGCSTEPDWTPAFEAKPCPAALAGFPIVCGDVRVPENHVLPDGRMLSLNVVVLRTAAKSHRNEAQFELDGGPGLAVVETAAFYATDGAMYRERRDIVFVDMRGTGGSNPLRCQEIERYEARDPWGVMHPAGLVADCAARLSAIADLSQYTTANAVRDLESVRVALGYDRVVLNALSYGTTLALAYIAEHPRRVRAAVLTGSVPAGRTPSRHHAAAGTAAIQKLFAACAADAACSEVFPDPAAELEAARANASSRAPEHGEIFMELVRARLYSAPGARGALAAIRRAAGGDFSDFDASPQGPERSFADGLYLSIVCAESLPHFDLEEARVSARATAFGDYRLRRQSEACAQWPVPAVMPPSPDRALPTPVLFVSGEYDPVAPSEWVEDLLPLFPNGRHVILPGAGHIVEGMSDLESCYDPAIVAFLDSADAAVDLECIDSMRPPGFVVE